MYSKEANIKIKVWGGPCSGVLLDSGRRQLWRESQKSLCMKIREFELYLPCQGRPLKDITGQWHDQMVNRSSKELFWRSGRKCTRKCDTWKENKPLERWKSPNVCVLVSFARNQSTWLADVIFFFQPRMWRDQQEPAHPCLDTLCLCIFYSDLRSLDIINTIGVF